MKKLILAIVFFTSIASADIGNTVSKKISDFISNLIPGEGITETSIEINDADNDNINFSILGVRNLDKTDDTNFFTQFSLKNEEKNSSGRLTGNLGFGYRSLNEDKSFMHGANIFLMRASRFFFLNRNIYQDQKLARVTIENFLIRPIFP